MAFEWSGTGWLCDDSKEFMLQFHCYCGWGKDYIDPCNKQGLDRNGYGILGCGFGVSIDGDLSLGGECQVCTGLRKKGS
jgi:hypothetical protein